MVVFIFLGLLVNISNLTGEQKAIADKAMKDIDDIKLSPEEVNLIEHLDELEAWELIENMELLQNLEILEEMEIKEEG